MRAPLSYEVGQRPLVAVIAEPNPLSTCFIKELIKNSCRPVIISENFKDWKKSAHTKGGEELQIVNPKDGYISQELNYVVLVDLTEIADGTSDTALKEREKKIEMARQLARKNSAKTLLVFSYAQSVSSLKNLPSLVEEILHDKDLITTVVYIGQLVGPTVGLSEEELLGRMIIDAADGLTVRIPRIDTYLYPTPVDEVTQKLLRNLFSFGAYGKSVAVLSEPISTREFFGLLNKLKPLLNFVYDDKDWRTSIARADEKITIVADLEKVLNETLKRHIKPRVATVQKPETTESRKQTPTTPKKLFLVNLVVDKVKLPPISRKWVWTTSLTACLIILTPISLLFTSAASLGLAKRMFVQGNVSYANRLLNVSTNTARFSEKYFLTLSKIFASETLAPLLYISNVLVDASDIGFRAVNLFDYSSKFFDKIVGDEIYDPTILTEEISLEFDALYRKLGFLEGDIESSQGLTRKIVEMGLNSTEIEKVRKKVLFGKNLIVVLPTLLGKNRPVSYLVLLQDNMELRPTGGFINTFSFVNFSEGRLMDITVSDVGLLDARLRGFVEPPAPIKDYLGEANLFLRDANWNPDFPSSAARLEWFLDKEMDRRFDGVVAFDIKFAKRVLEATGEVSLKEFDGKKINSQNLYDQVYRYNAPVSKVAQESTGGNFSAALSRALLEKILRLPAKDQAKAAGVIYESLEDKHVQVFLHDAKAQGSLSTLGWDGAAFPSASGPHSCGELEKNANCYSDWLGIVEANVGRNSANYFIERGASFSVLLEEGVVKRKLLLFLNNSAVRKDANNYEAYIRLLAPQDSGFGRVEVIDGAGKRRIKPEVYGASKRKEAGVLVEVEPGETKAIQFSWEGAANIDFDKSGEYRLYWRKQAGTENYPASIEFVLPNETDHYYEPEFSLTDQGTFGYNTVLSRDFVSRVSW